MPKKLRSGGQGAQNEPRPSLPTVPVGTKPTLRRTAWEAALAGSVSASTAATPGWASAQRQAARTASVA